MMLTQANWIFPVGSVVAGIFLIPSQSRCQEPKALRSGLITLSEKILLTAGHIVQLVKYDAHTGKLNFPRWICGGWNLLNFLVEQVYPGHVEVNGPCQRRFRWHLVMLCNLSQLDVHLSKKRELWNALILVMRSVVRQRIKRENIFKADRKVVVTLMSLRPIDEVAAFNLHSHANGFQLSEQLRLSSDLVTQALWRLFGRCCVLQFPGIGRFTECAQLLRSVTREFNTKIYSNLVIIDWI